SARALEVTVSGPRLPDDAPDLARTALERMLGLRVDLAPFYALARGDPRLDALATRFRGLKPPRFPTVFEALVNGIACQQLSLAVGIILLDRLTEHCGRAASEGGLRAFPRAADVAELRPATLRNMGFSTAKTLALRELSARVANGLDLETLAELDDMRALE